MTIKRIAGAVGMAVVVAAASISVAVVALPRLTDGVALTVLSGSMEPTYPVGSVLVVRPVDPADVQVGDVITFQNSPDDPSVTSHRVTEIERTTEDLSFTTKGDANKGEDVDPVPAGAVRGRAWFHVKYLGYLREAVSSPIGLATIVGLVSLTLVWDRVTSFVRRRLALPSRLPADVPGSPPAKTQKAPQIRESELETAAPALGPSDAATTASGDGTTAELTDVSSVTVDVHATARVGQQLMLARLNAGAFARGKVIELLGLVRGHVVSVGALHMVVTVTGTPEHLDGVEELLRSYGLVEASRSAVVHVGGARETDVPKPPASVGTSDANLKALVLRPPAPPSFALAGASSNGHHHEESDQ